MSDSCDPMDCSLPGFSVHGILQARILGWVAISFSRGSSWPRDWTLVSCIAGRFFTNWTTWEAPRILEWAVISFSNSSSWPSDKTYVSYIGRKILYCWTTGKLYILITMSLICMCITQEIPNIIKFNNKENNMKTRGCYICIKKPILQEQSKINKIEETKRNVLKCYQGFKFFQVVKMRKNWLCY